MTARQGNCFDFLRLFAAFAVVVQHGTRHLDTPFLWYEYGNGLWFLDGVMMFFILSGLMVFRSAEKCHEDQRGWGEFYRNRALRIIPAIYAYAVVILIALVVLRVLTFAELVSPQGIAFGLSHLVLMPVYHPVILDDFGVGVVNGSLWTIPVEVSFYLTVPMLVLAVSRFGFRRAITATVVVAAAGVVVFAVIGAAGAESVAGRLYGVTFLAFLWFFAIGIVWTRLWTRVPQTWWLAALGLVGYAVVAAVRETQGPGGAAIMTAVAAVPLSYSIVWFGHYGPQFLRHTKERIGDLSFGVYIWHMPVVNVLVEVGARDWGIPGTAKIGLAGAGTVMLAAASWQFVESRALGQRHYSVTGGERVAPLTVHPGPRGQD